VPTHNPQVAVMVLHHNGQKILYDCVSSLKKTTYTNYDVYVIDNASTDKSVNSVQQSFPWVKLIQFDKNYGFCQGYNKASEKIDAEYLLFLNNDVTILNSNWLDRMVEVAQGRNVGAVGSKLLLYSDPKKIENVGGILYKWQGGTRVGFGEKDDKQYDELTLDPFYVSGASLLIKRDLFIKAGGFDDEMFAYSEDLDLCWRLRLMGLEIKFCPDAILFHKASASWKKSMKALYLSHRNFVRASLKNYSRMNLLKNIPPLLLTSLLFGLFATLFSRNVTFLLTMIKSIGHNLLNFSSTLESRKFVQSNRRVRDQTVFRGSQNGNIESVSAIKEKLAVFA